MDADPRTVVFIGDELSAAGFRLAGLKTVTPAPDAAGEALREARAHAVLVIMTAAYARHLAPPELDSAILVETPAVAIVPDVRFQSRPPDLARRLRSILGIDT